MINIINHLPNGTLCIRSQHNPSATGSHSARLVQPNPAMAHVQWAHNGQRQSRADGPWAHPCYWDVLHTQLHLSPKSLVGDTAWSLHTPAQQSAVCWGDGCLNIEELSNKCYVHRAGKSFNNFSMFISQSKYSQCDVPTAKGVFFCLDQARVLYSTVALTLFSFPIVEKKKKRYCTKLVPII